MASSDKPAVNNEPAPGVYAPQRSKRVGANVGSLSDGDIWQERMAVCEGASKTGEPTLLIRSYYRNTRTQERVWDEPPSGAGTVVHATAEMKARAETQKTELQLTLEMIPPEAKREDVTPDQMDKKKVGLFGRFRKNSKAKESKPTVDTSRDLNLQKAIARSMADQRGNGSANKEPIVYYDESGELESLNTEFAIDGDEDIELAKALSISAQTVNDNNDLTEEELLQKAIAASVTSHSAGVGVARMPDRLDESASSVSTAGGFVGKSDPNESFTESKPPAIDRFDPYGRKDDEGGG